MTVVIVESLFVSGLFGAVDQGSEVVVVVEVVGSLYDIKGFGVPDRVSVVVVAVVVVGVVGPLCSSWGYSLPDGGFVVP